MPSGEKEQRSIETHAHCFQGASRSASVRSSNSHHPSRRLPRSVLLYFLSSSSSSSSFTAVTGHELLPVKRERRKQFPRKIDAEQAGVWSLSALGTIVDSLVLVIEYSMMACRNEWASRIRLTVLPEF